MRKLLVDDGVIDQITKIQVEYSFAKETGGILVGLYDAENGCIRLTDMSFPCPGDQQSRFRFFRKKDGHQELMDRLWMESGHTKAYLGEWHTHNEKVPSPSGTDCRTWRRIAKRDNNFEDCYFMIIGRETYIIWTMADDDIVEVFRGGIDGEK